MDVSELSIVPLAKPQVPPILENKSGAAVAYNLPMGSPACAEKCHLAEFTPTCRFGTPSVAVKSIISYSTNSP